MLKNPLPDDKQLIGTLRLIAQTARLWWLNSSVQNSYIKPLGKHLTPSDIQTLWELGATGAIRPSQLAHNLGLDKASITYRISRLVHQKLVEQIPDPSDKRATLVGLSHKGVKIVERSYAESNKAFSHMTSRWSDEEIETFSRLLRDYIDKTNLLLDGTELV